MALFEMHYRSEALSTEVTVNVILPEHLKNRDACYKTLFLLHGYGGTQLLFRVNELCVF